MIKKTFQFLFGLNLATLVRALRLGGSEFIDTGLKCFGAAHPLQKRADSNFAKELQAIPRIELGDILSPRKAAIKLNVQQYESGMLPSYEAMAILSVLVAENPRQVLEIGTFMGHTTRAMAENLPGGIIHTVDLPLDFSGAKDIPGQIPKDDFHLIRDRVVGREYKGRPVESQIRQHFGDTATIDFKEFDQANFFFIDGSHTYEYCKQDSEKCLALCRGVGTFLWHDCGPLHPGVVKFINEWRAGGKDIRIIAGTSIAYWKSR
jgi:hypothetical protein